MVHSFSLATALSYFGRRLRAWRGGGISTKTVPATRLGGPSLGEMKRSNPWGRNVRQVKSQRDFTTRPPAVKGDFVLRSQRDVGHER
ncbi:MAG: hypothetical protein V3R80_00920, partial [Candidatus Tectomicrobia bacterium]